MAETDNFATLGNAKKYPDDRREEGYASSCTSANKLLLPAECKIADR